jgi:(1->4)-alpha-D-glucan 1-alpha-D-glucosylmutase
VGGTPDRFGISIDEFHAHNRERGSFWPHALIATSTHDSKHSEDVKARINVLSEIPDKWNECLIKWSELNREKKIANNNQLVPDSNEEYQLYQTLIGAYPLGQMNDAEYEGFKKRIKDYMLKAIREAKVNTSWINPNINYENAMMNFINAIMNPVPENQFLKVFEIFLKPISYYGMYNSLSQTLLKITSPGVPDFYQGSEIWDFSLVDPDNRRPVDYGKRIKMLDDLKRIESEVGALRLVGELAVNKDNGMIKLYLTYKTLNYRSENREIFEMGEYIPINVAGKKADNVCPFIRKLGDRLVIAAAPRFYTKLIDNPENLPCGKRVWDDSFIIVPPGRYRNIFTGESVTAKSHEDSSILYLSDVFVNFPVALLEGIE